MSDTPNPGSDAAIDAGCVCPVLDNGHGQGDTICGTNSFWVNADCTIHGRATDWPAKEADHAE